MLKKQNMRRANARLYKYWQALFLASYSRKLYLDVAKRWRGMGYIYLFLLTSISILPFAARIAIDLNNYFKIEILQPVERMPLVRIERGHAILNPFIPSIVKNQNNIVKAIVTPLGTFAHWENMYPQLMILITDTQLYFRLPTLKLFFMDHPLKSNNKVMVQSLDGIYRDVFDGKVWVTSPKVRYLKLGIVALVYPLTLFFFFGMLGSFILAMGLLGQIIAQIIFKFKLTFKVACRLMVVASTVPMILLFGLISLNLLPAIVLAFVYVSIFAIYFSYAVLIVKQESKHIVFA